jgi:hypothetical protein
MMKKLLVAAATAGLLTVGGLAGAAPAAAATSGSISFSISAPHFAIAVNRPIYRPHPYLVCKPIYKRVYYKYHGHRYSKLVKVGQSCHWVYPSPRYPYRRY